MLKIREINALDTKPVFSIGNVQLENVLYTLRTCGYNLPDAFIDLF